MSLYDDLEINEKATLGEIREAFRKLAKKYHPDKKGGDIRKMKAINKAYAVLKNPVSRERYDRTGDGDYVDNSLAEVTTVVCQMIEEIMAKNFLDIMQVLDMMKQNLDKSKQVEEAKIKGEIKKLEKFKKRIIKSPKRDIVGNYINQKIEDLQRTNVALIKDFELKIQAVGILEEYEYAKEEKVEGLQTFTFTRIMNSDYGR